MKTLFDAMYALQMQLNNETNGKMWLEGFTKNGRLIDWNRAIFIETAEAVDSFNWKHWKDLGLEDNIENVKIEVVDIWHFMMSEHIRLHKGDVAAAAEEGYSIYKAMHHVTHDEHELIVLLERVAKNALSKAAKPYDLYRVVEAIDGFDINDLYTLYVGKNALNKFRQDNGYKDGTYRKLWDGVHEDNYFLQAILKESPEISYDELLEKLDAQYNAEAL